MTSRDTAFSHISPRFCQRLLFGTTTRFVHLANVALVNGEDTLANMPVPSSRLHDLTNIGGRVKPGMYEYPREDTNAHR